MLNLYLAPRSPRAPVPDEEAVQRALDFLTAEGFVGAPVSDDELPPGPHVAFLFHMDMHDELLPAELTFESMHVCRAATPRFLPERQLAGNFFAAACSICEDEIDEALLDESFARLGYFPVSRFSYQCPSCRTELRLRDIDFGQPTAIARFWFYIEGAATGRLNTGVVDGLGRALGYGLVVVPEVPEEEVEDWVPARRRWGRR